MELVERGPCIDFKVDRKKLASDDLYKTATRKPKELMVNFLKFKTININLFFLCKKNIFIATFKRYFKKILFLLII